MEQQNFSKLKEIVVEFFEKTALEIGVEIYPEKDQTVLVKLRSDDPHLLIGEGGQTLSDIQRLLKAVLRKQIEEPFYINVDVNDYREKKSGYLRELARSAADEVSLIKKEKMLAPMPASDRRVIHLELQSREDVITESAGEEPDRYVVIKPKP